MIYIDPSELRQSSHLLKYISDVVYTPLPGLELLTGADVMISPTSLPAPVSDEDILYHIQHNAILIQVKFGHDLPSSIIDNRLKESLVKMQKCKAVHWQSLLLFIGVLGIKNGDVTINGHFTYQQKMKWQSVQSAISLWTKRGGSIDYPLYDGKLLINYFAMHQNHLDTLKPKKLIYPQLQKLELVNDLRVLLCAIPDTKIGAERATAIFNYMASRDIRQDLSGFLYLVQSGELTNVNGIGPKLLSDIQSGLFKTRNERMNDGKKRKAKT